jgi:hypothetical protein
MALWSATVRRRWEDMRGDRDRNGRGATDGSATKGRDATEEELLRAHIPLVEYMVSEMTLRISRHVCRTDLVPRQATFARNEIAWSASLSLWRLRQAM